MAQTLLTQGHGTRNPQANLRELVEAYERRLIIEALVRAQGNQRRAAAELGLSPHHPEREDATAGAAGLRSSGRLSSMAGDMEMMGHA